MKTTLSMKLMTVLTHGTLSTMSYDELLAEIEQNYNSDSFQSIYTKDQAIADLKEWSYKAICYQFVPYTDNLLTDLCKVRQWSNKAQTVVNYVFNMIQNELK